MALAQEAALSNLRQETRFSSHIDGSSDCGGHIVLRTIAAFNSMLMDRAKDEGGPSDDLDGFLALHWHGAH